MKKKDTWGPLIHTLRKAVQKRTLPSVSRVAVEHPSPYRILVSTVISLRTKDEVTLKAAERLFTKAPDLQTLAGLTEKEILTLIYPAGFYKNKAKHLKQIARILIDQYDSRIPNDQAALLSLPGVGRKTANLVLNLGFGIPAICVDTHVHRVSNRIGWVATQTPEQTELALMKILPEKYWIEINELLVRFGQGVCTPVSPFCSRCPVYDNCRRAGVKKSR
ncbi:MAG: endonuclease III [Spirochaetales bacterium]|nr:endonuclease III [Spirochaetales bacterium]